MKNTAPLFRSSPGFRRHRRGMALVSVLAVLLLLTLLVVAFMGRATSSRVGAANYRATTNCRLLADVAVNLVQAQINEAVGMTIPGTAPSYTGAATGYVWASQPGAIRVFQNLATSSATEYSPYHSVGTLSKIYRLYSAAARTSTTVTGLANDLPSAATLAASTATWVDLNAPVTDAEGKIHYPILDPRSPSSDPTVPYTTANALTIPGFAIATTTTTTTPVNPATATSPAVMPVQWLYVLKDGAVIPPASTTNAVVVFTGKDPAGATIEQPSVKNPIVGRVAFWTDDDTSKVNINTAGGDDVLRTNVDASWGAANIYPADSIFWATPMFVAPDEAKMGRFQPSLGEFQRYAGHPATVGLCSLLSALCGYTAPMPDTDFFTTISGGVVTHQGITPRYAYGGSESNTLSVNNIPQADGNNQFILSTSQITTAGSRLYTSVAEMMFAAGALNSGSRVASPLTSDSPTVADAAQGVERANFFLSAHSNAPELNLFGEPRVSVWPIATLTSSQTFEDQLLAFDATVRTATGPEPYYFQRVNATGNLSTQAGSSTSMTTDATNASNAAVLKYLDKLTSSSTSSFIPGFGNNFSNNKYLNTSTPPATEQILNECFDYIRTTNFRDPHFTLASQAVGAHLPGTSYGSAWGERDQGAGDGLNQVVPSRISSWVSGRATQGNGSYPVLVEASIQFVGMGTGKYVNVAGANATVVGENPVPVNQFTNANLAHDLNFNVVSGVTKSPTVGGNPAGTPAPAPPGPDHDGAGATFAGDAIIPESAASFGYNSYYATAHPPGQTTPWLPTNSQTPSQGLGGSYNDPSNPNATFDGGGWPADQRTAMQAFILFSFVNPALCNDVTDPAFVVSITPATGAGGRFILNATGTTAPTGTPIYLTFPGTVGATTTTTAPNNPEATSQMVVNTDEFGTWNGSTCLGYIPIAYMTGYIGYGGYNPLALGLSDTTWKSNGGVTRHFPFYSQLVAVPGIPNVTGLSSTFNFSGANLTVAIGDAHADGGPIPGNTVTSYAVNFPSGSFPIPRIPTVSGRVIGSGVFPPTTGPPNWLQIYTADQTDRWTYSTNVQFPTISYYTSRIDPNDVVESVILNNTNHFSDARTLAMATVPATAFTAHPLYGAQMAHDLFADNYDTFQGNPGNSNSIYLGKLVHNVNYTYANGGDHVWMRYPVVPPTVNGVTYLNHAGQSGPGDWDNGLGNQTDGPWLNKADDGALPPTGQYTPYVPYYTVGNGFTTGYVATFSPNRMMPSPVMFGSLPTGISSASPRSWQTLLFRPGPNTNNMSAANMFSHPGEKNQPNIGDPPDHLFLDLFWMPEAEPYPISQPFATAGKINLNYEIQPFTYITRATALRALFAGEKIAVMPDAIATSAVQTASVYKVGDNSGGGAAGNGAVTTAMMTAATGGADANGSSRLPIDPDATLGLNFSAGKPNTDTATDTYGSSDYDSTHDPHATSGPTAQSGVAAWFSNTNASAGTTGTRFFKSASELCEMFLVPQGYNWNSFSGVSHDSHSWYANPVGTATMGDFGLVGDNTREKPYADLYSRVTTKSNTFTVYYRVQALHNPEPLVNIASPTATTPCQQIWDDAKGGVMGEYRGSTILERYLDPNEAMPDFQASPNTGSLEAYYKWRIVETRQFAP